ncbi:MAG: PAS domain S-box protein [Desulfobulbaceae bacterium]|nr:PAS domain S-box protein [Desulfobulbaceae bacterium]
MKGKPKYEELLARISTLEIECEQHPSCYQLFQLLTDNSPNFFWAKDLEGRYLFANRAMCEKLLLAEDTDEAIGKADIFFADRARRQYPERDDWHTFGELCIDSDQVVINNKQALRFDEYGNVNGKFLYLDVYKAPLFDDQGDMVGTVGSGRIVTREKAMEKKLRRSEEQFRSLADISPDLIYRLDSQGTIIYCSPSVVDLFGYEVDEVLGKKFQSFIYSDDMEQAEMFFHDFFSGSPRQEIELRLQNKSGDTVWTEINVASFPEHREPFGMQGIIRDISKRKQIEAQVFRSKQEWERTFDAVPDLIMILDPEHRIVKVNRAMADALDLDPAQCIGRFCYREIHNGSAPIEGCPQSRSVNDGKSHKTETWIEKFNGFFQISVSPIRDAGGNLIGSVHVMHDVTRLKKTEDVMQNLVDTLEQRVEIAPLNSRRP